MSRVLTDPSPYLNPLSELSASVVNYATTPKRYDDFIYFSNSFTNLRSIFAFLLL